MCRKVIAVKPTITERVCRASVNSSPPRPAAFNNGASRAVKTGSPTQPKPRLASVMPSCAALSERSRLLSTRRAILARHWPCITSASSWVSRILTSANSAATKKPFNATRTATARILKRMTLNSPSISQLHFPENGLQDVLQAHDAQLRPIPRQDNGQPLAGSLHLPKGHFEPQIVVEVECGLQE